MDLYRFLKKFRKSRLGRLMGRRTFTAAAAVVVFVTTYALILPAITQTTTTYCGKEEHSHTEACYTTEKVLTCDKEESDGHVHTDDCYQTTEKLVCGQEENDGHVHTDACYTEESELTCTNTDPEHVHDESCYTVEKVLTCGQEEGEGAHHHTADCYEESKELVCGQEEGSGAHHHTDACYKEEKTLTCTKEEHTHDKVCYANPNADTETAASWTNTMKGAKLTGDWAKDVITIAKTQIGYKESTKNYVLDSNGKKKGYTRYGAWYGNSYGDWCAMFCSFCINYADIPTGSGSGAYMPISAGCQGWIQKLNTSASPYYYAVNDKNGYSLVNGKDSVCWENPETEIEAYKKAHADDGTDLSSITIEDVCTKYHPQAGDLIFFNWDGQADADHVGLIESVSYAKDGSLQTIHTIEGNSSNSVKENSYKASNSKIMGFASMPENPELAEAESTSAKATEKTETTAEVEDIAADSAEMTEDEADEISDADEQAQAEELEKNAEEQEDADAENPDETAEADETADAETSDETVESADAENPDETVETADAETAQPDENAETGNSDSFEITDKASDGTTVSVSGDNASLPADASDVSVSITKLSHAEALKMAEAAGVDTEKYDVYAYDVSLYDGKTEIEPEDTVTVTFENEDTIGKIGTTKVYHFDDETADSEKMKIKDADEGYVQFETDSFSKYLVTTEGVTYDSDLEDFLTSATMTDYNGKTISNGDTVYIGQDYTITMSFAESNVSGAQKQFHYDDEGYLTYQVDTTNLVLKEVTNAPITQADGKVVGHYWLSTDGTLKVKFDNVDNTGAAIDSTYFEEYQNTVFNLSFDATVTANKAGETISIPFSDDIEITGTVDAGGSLNVEKTAGTANGATHAMDFIVKVTCTKGVVSNIVLTDTPSSKYNNTIYAASIDTSSITFTDLDGNELAEQPTVTQAEDGSITVNYPESLQAGEGFLLKYNVIADDDVYQAMIENCTSKGSDSVSGNVNFLNTVNVKGDNGTDTPVDVTKSVDQTSWTRLLNKTHSDTTIKDTSGNSIDVINWTINVGDGYTDLAGSTVTDTIGSALTLVTDAANYGNNAMIAVTAYRADGTNRTIYYSFDQTAENHVTLSDDGKTFTLVLPEDCMSCKISYNTTYEKNVTTDGAYTNTASVDVSGYSTGTVSNTSTAGNGVPTIEKTVTGSDDQYIYYQMTIDVPASLYGQKVYINDEGISVNYGGRHYSMDLSLLKDFKVTVQKDSDENPVEYTQASTGAEGTYSLVNTNGTNGWQLALQSTDASRYVTWPINEHSVMTITFAYPRSAVSEGMTLDEALFTGAYARNSARVYYGSNYKSTAATYYSTPELVKTGEKRNNGNMYYQIDFATYTTNNDSGTRTAAISKPFSNAYLYDNYDSQLEFAYSGIYVEAYNVQTKKYAIFEADFDDVKFNESESSFKAYWKDFVVSSTKGGLTVADGTDLETFLNGEDLANYKLYFYYYMYPTQNAVKNSPNSISLSNEAKIGYTGTSSDGNPYTHETPTASLNYIYTTDILEKTGTQSVAGGNEINYTIDLNSDVLDLSDGDTYQVEDQMSSNMSLYLDSIVFTYNDFAIGDMQVTSKTTEEEFTAAFNTAYPSYSEYAAQEWEVIEWMQENCKVTYDETNHKITFTVPDDYHVTITYTTKISDTGSSVTVSNTATIKGLTSASSGGEATYQVNNTSGSAAASKKYLYVLKQNSMNLDPVIGAKIALYGDTDKGIIAPEGVDQTITVNRKTLYYYATYESATNTVQTLNGTFTITDDYLADGGLYALKEIDAPDGYLISEDPIPFYWEVEGVSEKDGIQVKSNRGTLIFQNTPQSYALPSTGGMGTRPFTIAGLLLMAGAALMLFLRPKGKTGKM